MRTRRPRRFATRRLRLPRRTARLRLTVLYGAAFLACGAAVLAVIAYLVLGGRKPLPSTQPTSSVAAQLTVPVADVRQAGRYYILKNSVRVPAADVHEAGRYYILKNSVRVPAADVHEAGRYDIVAIPGSGATTSLTRKPPVLTPAERTRLLAGQQFRYSYDTQRILTISAIALAVIAIAAAAIGWLIAGRVLRPLSTITATARRIAASSLHERLALQGPDDELKELADTLDNLLARLEASFDAQRRFAANASHELRTPLTRERTLIQVTLADPQSTTETWHAVSRELLASNAEQERLIEALLTLASSEAGTSEHLPVDLAAATSAAMADARPAISRLGLHVQANIQPAVLDGDPLLVQQLVTNLIDNALRHNIPNGDVHVATRTSSGSAVLSVMNSGQVIPAAEADRLFQPFQRLSPRTARRDGGHGLGLSIVRAIATAHAATITAQPRPSGGLAVDVIFPLPTPPEAHQPLTGRMTRV